MHLTRANDNFSIDGSGDRGERGDVGRRQIGDLLKGLGGEGQGATLVLGCLLYTSDAADD